MQPAVLIPARNEGPRLGAVLAELERVLPGAQWIVVDGDSQDDTAQVARAAGALVLSQRGPGYARALATGYRFLAEQGVQRALQLDADGQHPPEALPALLEALEGHDLVFASRAGTDSGGPWGRRAGNAALALMVRRRTGLPLQDVMAGMWASNARAIQTLAALLDSDCADANIRVAAWRAGLRLREHPVRMPERSGGASMHDGLSGLRNFARSVEALWLA